MRGQPNLNDSSGCSTESYLQSESKKTDSIALQTASRHGVIGAAHIDYAPCR